MIFLALGSNLPGPWGEPREALDRALYALENSGIELLRRSSWYQTAPYGGLPQSNYVNGVVAVATHRSPAALLRICHSIENRAGRRRGVRWGSRTLDLDLLAYHNVVSEDSAGRSWRGHKDGIRPLVLPHPEIAVRPFVLVPLAEIAPSWHHPVTGLTPGQMLKERRSVRGGEILRAIS